jgi:hypothetical protein
MIRNEFCDSLHAEKYRGPNETFRDAMNRIANAMKDDEDHYHAFRDILLDMRFMPAGRVQAAMGAPKVVTAYNCLSGETLITTRDGVRRLGDLAGTTVSLLDGNGEWQFCMVNAFGSRQLFDVRFRKEVVKATADHRWILLDGTETTTAKLRPGDKVAHVRAQIDMAGHDDGVCHGLIYGDGTRIARKAFSIRLCGEKRELQNLLPAAVTTHPPSLEGDPWIRIDSPIDMKSLPVDPSPGYLLGFLRGWLATDGCVSKQPEVVMTMGHKEAAWLKIHAPTVGFHPIGMSRL